MSRLIARRRGQAAGVLLAVQLGCFVGGASLVARPAGRLVRRVAVEWRAARTWEAWKAADRESRCGDPLAWLTAKDAGLSTLVLFDATKDNMSRFPCWAAFGGRPGEPGLGVIQAHRDMHFRTLDRLKLGSAVELETTVGIARYRVADIEIMETPQAERRLAESRDEDRLVLMTCYPFRYFGPAPQRYLVWLEHAG